MENIYGQSSSNQFGSGGLHAGQPNQQHETQRSLNDTSYQDHFQAAHHHQYQQVGGGYHHQHQHQAYYFNQPEVHNSHNHPHHHHHHQDPSSAALYAAGQTESLVSALTGTHSHGVAHMTAANQANSSSHRLNHVTSPATIPSYNHQALAVYHHHHYGSTSGFHHHHHQQQQQQLQPNGPSRDAISLDSPTNQEQAAAKSELPYPTVYQSYCPAPSDSSQLMAGGYLVGSYQAGRKSTGQQTYLDRQQLATATGSGLAKPIQSKNQSGIVVDQQMSIKMGSKGSKSRIRAAAAAASMSKPQLPALATTLVGGTRRKNASRESTAILKQWLERHLENPYPSKGEKIMLNTATRMNLTQISTWFANARRRMKKERKLRARLMQGHQQQQQEHQLNQLDELLVTKMGSTTTLKTQQIEPNRAGLVGLSASLWQPQQHQPEVTRLANKTSSQSNKCQSASDRSSRSSASRLAAIAAHESPISSSCESDQTRPEVGMGPQLAQAQQRASESPPRISSTSVVGANQQQHQRDTGSSQSHSLLASRRYATTNGCKLSST